MTEFFGPGSPYLTHPLLTRDRSSIEVDVVLENSPDGTRDILDIGCGFGRHALEFAERGLDVVAIDRSAAMITESRNRMDAAGLAVEFVEIGGEHFVRENSFDLAISLFTSLGQVQPGSYPEDDKRLVQNVRRSLRPGGVFVVELPERHRARAALVAEETLGSTAVTRWFDDETAQIHERFTTPARSFDLSYRLYTSDELESLVSSCGFVVREVRDEAIVSPPHTFMTLVAECQAG